MFENLALLTYKSSVVIRQSSVGLLCFHGKRMLKPSKVRTTARFFFCWISMPRSQRISCMASCLSRRKTCWVSDLDSSSNPINSIACYFDRSQICLSLNFMILDQWFYPVYYQTRAWCCLLLSRPRSFHSISEYVRSHHLLPLLW